MPLFFKDSEFLADSAEVKRDGLLDILKSPLLRFSFADTSRKERTANGPTSVLVMLKDNWQIHRLYLCNNKYTMSQAPMQDRVLLPEDHTNCEEKKNGAEAALKKEIWNLIRDDRTDPTPQEKSQTDKSGDAKFYVTAGVIFPGGEEPDRRDKDRKRCPLRLMLCQFKEIHKRWNEQYPSSHPHKAAQNPRRKSK